jgi:hypothetical protein
MAGGGGIAPGAQINFGDLTPYLTFGFEDDFVSCSRSIREINDIKIKVSYCVFVRKNGLLENKIAKSI